MFSKIILLGVFISVSAFATDDDVKTNQPTLPPGSITPGEPADDAQALLQNKIWRQLQKHKSLKQVNSPITSAHKKTCPADRKGFASLRIGKKSTGFVMYSGQNKKTGSDQYPQDIIDFRNMEAVVKAGTKNEATGESTECDLHFKTKVDLSETAANAVVTGLIKCPGKPDTTYKKSYAIKVENEKIKMSVAYDPNMDGTVVTCNYEANVK